jgi:hypothetical protein
MIVEFKVIRHNDKIIRVSSNNENYPTVGAELPLVTTGRIGISIYAQLPENAALFYRSLLRQLEGVSLEASRKKSTESA